MLKKGFLWVDSTVIKLRKCRNSVYISLVCFPNSGLVRIRCWHNVVCILRMFFFPQGNVVFQFLRNYRNGGTIIFCFVNIRTVLFKKQQQNNKNPTNNTNKQSKRKKAGKLV